LRDGPILGSQLRRLVTRTTGYNCTLRVRASYG
jgi:protein transport protein SEC24